MSDEQTLADAVEALPRRVGNPVKHALSQVSEHDREVWEDALLSGGVSQAKLAQTLALFSGASLTSGQVADYKRKMQQRKV